MQLGAWHIQHEMAANNARSSCIAWNNSKFVLRPWYCHRAFCRRMYLCMACFRYHPALIAVGSDLPVSSNDEPPRLVLFEKLANQKFVILSLIIIRHQISAPFNLPFQQVGARGHKLVEERAADEPCIPHGVRAQRRQKHTLFGGRLPLRPHIYPQTTASVCNWPQLFSRICQNKQFCSPEQAQIDEGAASMIPTSYEIVEVCLNFLSFHQTHFW